MDHGEKDPEDLEEQMLEADQASPVHPGPGDSEGGVPVHDEPIRPGDDRDSHPPEAGDKPSRDR